MGKLTISMAIFHSYVSHYQRVQQTHDPKTTDGSVATETRIEFQKSLPGLV